LASPALEAFNNLTKKEVLKIGFVGTPCQILALAKRKICRNNADKNIEKLKLTIGLFCNWSLSHNVLSRLSQIIPTNEIKKMDVPSKAANSFQVFTEKEVKTISLEEVTKYIRPACYVCLDMTSELADISIGVARGMPEWNTVIIRTETGKRLINHAKKAGIIETGVLPLESLENLKKASLRRKKITIRKIVSQTGRRDDLIYLNLRQEVVDSFLNESDNSEN
jgi:coenzyme F420 hydrogenase subunit beta